MFTSLLRWWKWLTTHLPKNTAPGSDHWWRQKLVETWNEVERLKPASFDDASEPDEPLRPWDDPNHDVMSDLAYWRDQLTKIAGPNPDLEALSDKVVAYPPKVEEESAKDWVTAELERRTGGITRHPMDLTNYPTPPTEQDQAAREYVNREIESTYGSGANARPVARGYFTHGMSMRYLGELLDRAKRKDPTLTDEDLMALRSRGLI